MSSRTSPRSFPVLAGALAAGIMLTSAGCSQVPPLQQSPPSAPSARHLGSPIVLQAMRSQASSVAGTCPPGWIHVPVPAAGAASASCYRPVGTPVTIKVARVAAVSTVGPPPAEGQTAQYGLSVIVPGADVPAVTALISNAYHAKEAIGVTVAGKTWEAPQVDTPFSGQQLQIALPSRRLAVELYRLLVPS